LPTVLGGRDCVSSSGDVGVLVCGREEGVVGFLITLLDPVLCKCFSGLSIGFSNGISSLKSSAIPLSKSFLISYVRQLFCVCFGEAVLAMMALLRALLLVASLSPCFVSAQISTAVFLYPDQTNVYTYNHNDAVVVAWQSNYTTSSFQMNCAKGPADGTTHHRKYHRSQ
jgi:hypothetical protein